MSRVAMQHAVRKRTQITIPTLHALHVKQSEAALEGDFNGGRPGSGDS